MHLSRSSSRIDMLTLGIRNIAGLPVLLESQKTGPDEHQRGHFYLAITCALRIMYIMLNYRISGWPSANPINSRQLQDGCSSQTRLLCHAAMEFLIHAKSRPC